MRARTFIILAAIVGGSLAVGGCVAAKRQALPASKPMPATTRSADRAELTLDQIDPRPVLSPTTRSTATTQESKPPLEAVALFAQARDFMLQGQRFTAINLLEKAIQIDPSSYELRYWLAKAYSGNGMPADNAIAACEAAAKIDPDHIEIQSELGRLYLGKGNLPRAIEHLRLALQTGDYNDDQNASALVDFYLARALQQAGYDRAALDCYGSLIDRLQLGGLETRGSPELAYLVAQPESLFVQVGELCERRGVYDEAIKLYRAAAEHKPDEFGYHAHVVRALLAAGRQSEATQLATELVRQFKVSTDSLNLLKETFKKTGGDEAMARELDRLHRERPADRSVLYALVDVLSANGKTADAQRLLNDAARGTHYDTELVRRLFKLYDAQDDIDGGARLLIEALAARPDNTRDIVPLWTQLLRPWRKNHLTVTRLQALNVPPQARAAKQFWIASMARIWNREALSRSALEQAVKQVPPFAPAYRGLFAEYQQRTDWNDAQKRAAVADLVEAVDKQGDAALAGELRGLQLLNEKQPSRAAEQFAKARDAGGESPDLRLAYATALEAAGDGARSQQVLWKLIDDQPTCEDAYLRLFRTYLEAQDAQQAIHVLNTWLNSDPSSVNAKILLSTVRFQAGQADVTEQILLDLFEREPDNGDVLSALNNFYGQTGKIDKWIEKLEAQRVAHPENRTVVEQLVLLYANQKRMPEAIRVLDSVRQAVSEDPDLLYYIAGLYTRIGERQSSEQALEQVVKLDPQHGPACNDLGYAWADEGQNLSRAEALIRIAVQKEPDNQSFLDSLGWVLYKRSKFAEARTALEEAIGSSSLPDPVVLDHLGDTLYRLDKKPDAEAQWKRSQERLGKAGEGEDDRDDTRKLRLQLQQKLKQAESGQPVSVAPVAQDDAAAKQAKH